MLLLTAEGVCGASFCILRAIFVATQTGEVSEVEIFLRFVGVPEPALSSVFARTCSQPSVFFRVHPLSVRELTFTCMRGSVIFINMLDFAATYGLASYPGHLPPLRAHAPYVLIMRRWFFGGRRPGRFHHVMRATTCHRASYRDV